MSSQGNGFSGGFGSSRNDTVMSGAACVLAVLLIALQAYPLFWRVPFATDWVNHVWIISYVTDHFLKFYWFPTTIDVETYFGEPTPLFYGMFFYPFMVPFSLLLGADLSLRTVCAVLLLAPLVTYAALFKSITRCTHLAILLSITINASVYQLTNLYTRSAITEFVAVQLLLIAISLVFYGSLKRTRVSAAALYSGFAFAATSFGSHPITFYTFAIFIIPLVCMLSFPLSKVIDRRQFKNVSIAIMLLAIVLLPWMYLVWKYKSYTTIDASLDFLVYFPGSIDSLWGRIGLLYVDTRVFVEGIKETATPFLDAPFSIGLLFVVMFIGLRSARKSALIGYFAPCAVFVVVIFVCATPPISDVVLLPPAYEMRSYADESLVAQIFAPIQFAYRLAATFALVMAFALALGLAFRSELRNSFSFSSSLFVGLCACISVLTVAQKASTTYLHYILYPSEYLQESALYLPWDDYLSQIDDVREYPTTFYGQGAYAMPKIYASSSQDVLLGRQRLAVNFSKWQEAQTVHCEISCAVTTNILPSQFSQVAIDGAVQNDMLVQDRGTVVILADPGLHTIEVEPRGRIPVAIQISIGIALVWLYASTIFLFWTVFVSRPKLWHLVFNHR